MSKIWRELADPKRHSDFMSYVNDGGVPVKKTRDNLIEEWVYFAEVKDFTFIFVGMEQVEEARNYFSKKIHPSTREPNNGLEHNWHKWYCRLPKGMTKETNRTKVLKALDKVIDTWGIT